MAREDYWEWLNLVETDGPFLSKSALKSFYPSGLPKADASVDDVNAVFVSEHSRWMADWQTLSGDDYTISRNRWVETVLRDLLEWGDFLNINPSAELGITSPDGRVEVHPFATLEVVSGVKAIVLVVDKSDDLRTTGTDGWAADSIDRMSALLRASTATIGIVTDGRWWALVSAAPETTTASGVFDATWWRGEEKPNRDSFFALANISSIALGAPEKRLDLLFQESVASAEQITEALGDQVRRAVELVLQSMSDSHLRSRANGETSPLPADARKVYEGAVTILMRVVFLLFAEERGLFPQHELFRTSYSISGIRQKLSLTATENSEESLDHSAETWHRLLAVSQAVYGGATFDDIRMPAYGGSLFDPDRFPWMYATDTQGKLLLRISDRVMFAVLDAVQIAQVDGEARGLSFRDLDVEQIGYVYEGLLGYSAEYVNEVVIGLEGKSGYEPEITLAELENIKQQYSSNEEFVKQLLEHLKVTQEFSKPRTANQLSKALRTSDADTLAVAKTRLRHALLGDEDLVERLLPFHSLIRNDLRSFPYVVSAGGLVMTESQQRSNTGTHYTPRSLAEEVVLHALEPLVYSPGPLENEDSSQWKLKSSTEILNLKVADIAVGSGAFLVAAARYLAARLIEARAIEGLDIAQEHDIERWAIREVVARCLYGADINGMAVEMCKLSLWLISMDPGKPFSFVDDRILIGDSLIGISDPLQLSLQHIYPKLVATRPQKLLKLDIDSDLSEASELRTKISATQVDLADVMRTSRAKMILLEKSKRVTSKLSVIADGLIAAGLKAGAKPGKHLDAEFDHLSDTLHLAFPSVDYEGDFSELSKLIDQGLRSGLSSGQKYAPQHWLLSSPEIFYDGDGFDAVIGNPPFLGGKKISNALGLPMHEWLVNAVAGKTGNGDLVAYFFLRAFQLLAPGGVLGLIATNSIAQGDTREIGLHEIELAGGEIYRSERSRQWPAQGATLSYATVWIAKTTVTGAKYADGIKTNQIDSYLEAAEEIQQLPQKIASNKDMAYQGCIPLGKGFVITEELAMHWIEEDPRNRQVLRKYITGQDVNQSLGSQASRWIIYFGEMDKSVASSFKLPWEHLELNVFPERKTKDAKKYPRMVNEWWKYWNPRKELTSKLDQTDSVIVLARVSSSLCPVMVTSNQVFSEQCIVFPTGDMCLYAILSSSLHKLWAIRHGSTLGDGVRYVPTDVFETFPLPQENTQPLEALGEQLSSLQSEVLSSRKIGVTDLHNLLSDGNQIAEDLNTLRQLQREIDLALVSSYGWEDLDLEHGFFDYRQVKMFTLSPEVRSSVLLKLLELNMSKSIPLFPAKSIVDSPISEIEREIPEGAMF